MVYNDYLVKKQEYGNLLTVSESTPELEEGHTQEFNCSFLSSKPNITVSDEISYKNAKDESKTLRLANVVMRVVDAAGVTYFPDVTVNSAMEVILSQSKVDTSTLYGVRATGKIAKESENPYNSLSFRIDPLLVATSTDVAKKK